MKKSLANFLIFSLLGGIGVLGYYLTLVILTEIFSLSYIISSLVGYAVNTIVSFPIHKGITFGGKEQKKKISNQFIEYVGISFAYFLINWMFLILLTEKISIPYLYSQGILTVTLSYINYGATDSVFK